MSELFPAHIRLEHKSTLEEAVVQSVQQHCRNTAGYASQVLSSIGLEQTAYLAGLLHDSGKFTNRFQKYLTKAIHNEPVQRGSVNHTFAGTRLLLERYHGPDCSRCEDIVCELLAYAVGAHHGLFDCIDEQRRSGFQHRLDKPDIDYPEASANFLSFCAGTEELDELFSSSVEELTPIFEKMDQLAGTDDELFFYIGLLSRLLLSAVIEGDRKDTAEFMGNFTFPASTQDKKQLWADCLACVEQKLSSFPSDTPIQKARQRISQQCRDFAERPGGVYRLNVPTGAGKTLSSLRYALSHAAQWNKRRILFVMPLLSITEQNAKVIRDYVQNDRLIFEHHSNIVRPTEDTEAHGIEQELLMENWDASIIITTLVQLLNTLFSGKTTSIRRLHSLCGSVIVIDEVQTVPARMLSQFNLAVNFLSEICNATVILCSATQPCLEQADHPLAALPQEIVPYDPALWSTFQRTKIQDAGSYLLAEIPSFAQEILEETNSLLIVCNTKKEAETLYRQLEHADCQCFHLSAAMCMAHRRKTLAEIQRSLNNGKKTGSKTLCISTQVIEAGVDISFSRVIRLSAGMDSVVQSAGRCNRNGESKTIAPVYLIQCADESLSKLRDIQQAQVATADLLAAFRNHSDRFQSDLSSDAAIQYFYQRLYAEMPQGFQDFSLSKERLTLYDLLSLNNRFNDGMCPDADRFFLKQAFKLAGSLFQVFDEDTTDVLVPYEKGTDLIMELCTPQASHDITYAKQLLEQAKAYTISLFQYQKKQLEEQGALQPLCDGSILALQDGYYDDHTGLILTQNSTGYLEV